MKHLEDEPSVAIKPRRRGDMKKTDGLERNDRLIHAIQQGGMGYGDAKWIAGFVRTYISGCLPASNRKSCDISEHYMLRYKEGWNAYRAELIKRIFNDKNV